jgi:hypothetical protein
VSLSLQCVPVLMHSQCANERHQKFTRGRMNDDFGISCFPAFASLPVPFLSRSLLITLSACRCQPATDALSALCSGCCCCSAEFYLMLCHNNNKNLSACARMGASPLYDNCNIKPSSLRSPECVYKRRASADNCAPPLLISAAR